MDFEFDKDKSYENKLKHGMSFEEAQQLWLDPGAVMGPANSIGEERLFWSQKLRGFFGRQL